VALTDADDDGVCELDGVWLGVLLVVAVCDGEEVVLGVCEFEELAVGDVLTV